MFTSATRAAIEKIQQQYGLPVNGIWGSLERQVFDNARVRTLPPSSAASLMPPDYNRTTNAVKYQKAVVSQRPAPAASKLSKTFPTATIPTAALPYPATCTHPRVAAPECQPEHYARGPCCHELYRRRA